MKTTLKNYLSACSGRERILIRTFIILCAFILIKVLVTQSHVLSAEWQNREAQSLATLNQLTVMQERASLKPVSRDIFTQALSEHISVRNGTGSTEAVFKDMYVLMVTLAQLEDEHKLIPAKISIMDDERGIVMTVED